MSRNEVRQVYLCALISGGAGLVYEILWNRYLLLIFGSTTYSAAAVLAIFLGGLALGAGAVVRWERKIRNPLLWYGFAESSVALYAIVLPYSLPYLDTIAAAVTRGGSAAGSIGTSFILGGAALLPPSIALGAGLPLLAMSRQRVQSEEIKLAGALYGFNTLGAAAGALGAGFLFLPALGMRGTLAVAVLMSVIAAGISFRLASLHRPVRVQPVESPKPAKAWSSSRHGLLTAVFLSSLAALGYEVVWTRILVLVIGSSTYAFSLVVAVFVFGTALGSFSIGKRIGQLRAPAEVFVHVQAGVALLAVASLFLYAQLPELFLKLFGSATATTGLFFAQFIVVGLVILPPTILIGAAFPLAVRLVSEPNSGNDGSSFGLVFGLTALGNVFGVLLVSLVLIPVLGLQQGLLLLAVLNLFSGLLVLWLQPDFRYRAYTAGAAVGGLLLLWVLKPTWDPIIMTSGVYAKAPVYRELAGSEAGLKRILGMYRMRYYREGMQTVVSVVQNPTLGKLPSLALAVDGKVDASTGKDMSTQVLSGQLPFAFNATAREVLLIGLASGVTAGSVATHPVKHITVVEIEPAVGEAAREFSAFNNRVLDDPRLELIYDDGRHFLAVSDRKFDLIISEPSNPWMSGPARLFTREFFILARGKLRTNGVFAQWIPLYGLGPRYFRSLLKTFLDVFPEATAFRVAEGDLLLIGGGSPLQISLAGLERAFAAPGIREDLARIGVVSPGALLAKWIGGKATLLAVAGEDGEINTDDNGLVEFGAPRFLNQPTLLENLSFLQKGRKPAELESILRLDSPNSKSAEILIDAAEAAILENNLEFAGEVAGILKKRNHLSAFHYVRGAILLTRGENESARSAWRMVQPGSSVFVTATLRLAELELDSEPGADAADETLRQIPQATERTSFNFLQGRIALRQGDPDQALRAFRRATPDNAGDVMLEVLLYRYLANTRKGDQEGSRRARQEIFYLAQRTRRAAERDQGQIVIDRLLAAFSLQKTRWLKPVERAQLEEWLRTWLLEPLSQYYRGVSLLWSGKEQEAGAALRRAALALPAPDPGSMIHYFLALSIQNNDPAGALKLLRAFADARAAEPKGGDWLYGEMERLMAKLLSRLSSGR